MITFVREVMMSSWETCEIKNIQLRAGGLLKSPIYQWQAHQMTASGSIILFKGQAVEFKGYDIEKKDETAYQKLIAHLKSEGWQPAETSDERIISMKRRLAGANSQTATHSPADLLRQLENLRDAGVLTEQEFQTKKAEILKRM
jgi:hypothetical protein